MVLTLYGIDASPPVRAIRMVINKLNISDVEYMQVNPLQGDQNSENFLKMNPQHCIPTLKDDEFIVWDSHAIAAYLVSSYGADDSLNPTEPKQRAIIDQRLHFDSGILFPALRQSIVNIKYLVLLDKSQYSRRHDKKPVFFAGINSFDPESLANVNAAYQLAEQLFIPTRDWLAGDYLTLADICCFATISTLNLVLPIDPGLFPNLWNWLHRCSEMDFMKKSNGHGLAMFAEVLNSKLA